LPLTKNVLRDGVKVRIQKCTRKVYRIRGITQKMKVVSCTIEVFGLVKLIVDVVDGVQINFANNP
jgi:hypothetical protein